MIGCCSSHLYQKEGNEEVNNVNFQKSSNGDSEGGRFNNNYKSKQKLSIKILLKSLTK